LNYLLLFIFIVPYLFFQFVRILSVQNYKCTNSETYVCTIRINGPRDIYYNNERIKAHSFNAREKREMVAPSASATLSSTSVTQLSASASASARVMSSLVEMRRAGCAVRSVSQTDGRRT
jgi:hypothetical protein